MHSQIFLRCVPGNEWCIPMGGPPSAIRPFRSGLEQQETLLSLRYVKKLHLTFGLHRSLNVDLTFWWVHDFYKSLRHAKISYIHIEWKNWYEGPETSKIFVICILIEKLDFWRSVLILSLILGSLSEPPKSHFDHSASKSQFMG